MVLNGLLDPIHAVIRTIDLFFFTRFINAEDRGAGCIGL